MSDLKEADWSRIVDLTGVTLEDRQIIESSVETRLKFNAPTPVHYLAITAQGWRFELFHWLEEDEWELVDASRFA